MTRRHFCQLTLAATLASTLPALSSETLPLSPIYGIEMKDGQLEVTLSLENVSSKPQEILTRRGSSHCIELSVRNVGDTSWEELKLPRSKLLDEMPMSRVGPRPVWLALDPGNRQNFGTFRGPFNKKGQVFDLALKVLTREGPVEFPPERANVRS